jgi:hypothetical protein
MPRRKCSTNNELERKTTRQIIVPLSKEAHHLILKDAELYREWLERMIAHYPELFPADIQAGYTLHSILPESKKMPGERKRRIKLKARDENGKCQVYTIAPSYLMPYMTGYTDEIADALFLSCFGVPCWALAVVFGHSDMFWQRHMERLGRNDLVGTTIKDPEALPEHVLADEKHTRWNGQKAYIATTAGADCVVGASVSLNCDTEGLIDAYGRFKDEAQRLQPDYQPETVNVDGWAATHNAWLILFPAVTIVLCFLHAFLKIRSCCKRLADFPLIKHLVWQIYQASDPTEFCHRVGDLYAWMQRHLADDKFKRQREAIQKLCAKTGEFLVCFDHPDAYRTSNMIDRHMLPLDQWLSSMQFFHGHLLTAEFLVRAWALMHNFIPYCPRATIRKTFISPAHRLNDFIYHENWLQNLLISSSGQPVYAHHRIR